MMRLSAVVVRRFACSSRSKFQEVMRDTLALQQSNIIKALQGRGIYYSLLALDSTHTIWDSTQLRSTVRNNLLASTQKINQEYHRLLNQHFHGDAEVISKFADSSRQYTSTKVFKAPNNKTLVLKEFGQPVAWNQQYHHLLIEVPPTQHTPPEDSSAEPELDFKADYRGTELAAYAKDMFSFDHLHFQDGQFQLKYNEKLVKHYPPNIVYNYVKHSSAYPLHMELIDLPTLYQVEDINLNKSIQQLDQLFTLASHANIFTKLKFMKEFIRECPTCSSNKRPPELPQGYLSILALDNQLFSGLKLGYMYQKIAAACQQNTKPQTILVAVGEEYIDRLKDHLQSNLEGLSKPLQTNLQLSSIRKSVTDGLEKLHTEDVPTVLKRSVMVELLLETNTETSAELFEQLDSELAKGYIDNLQTYTHRLSLEYLNPNADKKLVEDVLLEQKCFGLQLIFGTEQQQIQSEYSEELLKKEFEHIDAQATKEDTTDKQKIKLKKLL